MFLGDFENWLEGRFVFSHVLLFVLLHFLFCAEDAVYIGTHGLEFFVIILEIIVSIYEDYIREKVHEQLIGMAKRMLEDDILSLEKIAEYSGLELAEAENL